MIHVLPCIDLILTKIPNAQFPTETGASDFQLLIPAQLKMAFQKNIKKIIVYRDYKKFDNAKFCNDINNFVFD